ncbi:MAG TPA: sugar ABC transporter ATP-binding protein [Fimbriimonadaceae bacterium]|nr:sugar ABC transporter ATP-binding protein [Fimbriimonadaceae bacterium]
MTTPEAPMVAMRGIVQRFGATVALAGVDFEAHAGEVHAIVGENGSGKSTLMRVLAGTMRPDEGSMELEGRPFAPHSPAEARVAGVAMIHQELTIVAHESVLGNVLLGIEPTRFGWLRRSQMEALARPTLSALGLGDVPLDMPAGRLPIAAQQLVEIARALVTKSKVVILDEPTSSLTEVDVKRLFEVMRELKARGHALIYISHFLNEVRAIADTMTVLRDGTKVGERPVAGVTDDEIVSMMVGREIGDLYPRRPHTPGEAILRIDGLAGTKSPVEATLEVCRGEVVGIAGLNGSGRSELLRTIFGLDQVRRGQIRVGSFSGAATPHRRWAEGVGMLSEDRKAEGLAVGLSIAENTCLASLRSPFVSPARQLAAGQVGIDRLSIRARGPGQRVSELSGGNQQKVALARMLHHGVDLMLLDEPTRGIDVGSKEQIYRLIDEAALSGQAVLVVSSYLPELLGVCDRIAVMHRGRLGPARPVAGLTQESVMREAVGA